MKKKCILALVLGAAFMAQGCGYTEGTDAVVTVVDATPTPEPTEAPEPTATPEPQADAASCRFNSSNRADTKRHHGGSERRDLLCCRGREFTF